MSVAPERIGPDHLIGGKYRLREQLAEGGMGAVWLAQHEVLGVDVAVKLMSADVAGTALALARFEREAKASAQLKSNHIVRIHDYGIDDGTPFIAMELLHGEDLGRRLKRDGPMSIAELAPILSQVCKGLEVACEAGIVHRDLKPSNVFLAREGDDMVAKLVDFGVARETKDKLVEDETQSGIVVGSPHHMSPEQAHGKVVDHRSDLWSLGVLAFEALTGQKPFRGEAMASILLEVVSKPIPKASELRPELPADVDLFLRRALSRDLERRFQRAREMAEAFEAIARGDDVAPFLRSRTADRGIAAGREDETVPSMERVSSVGPGERSGSREVGAITAGVSRAPDRTRWWLWTAAGAALLFGAFQLGRAGSDAPATPPVPSAEVTTQARAEPNPASPVPSASDTQTASEPPKGETSATASALPAARPVVKWQAPATAQKPPAVAPKPAPAATPRPAPRIDPFTGLPATD